jgi:hypothetical protein
MGLFQDGSNVEYACVVGMMRLSNEAELAVEVEPSAAVPFTFMDAKSLVEGSMKGDELGPASYSVESERRCASCCWGDVSGLCSSFGPSLMSC